MTKAAGLEAYICCSCGVAEPPKDFWIPAPAAPNCAEAAGLAMAIVQGEFSGQYWQGCLCQGQSHQSQRSSRRENVDVDLRQRCWIRRTSGDLEAEEVPAAQAGKG